jgi:hypothetical protein
MMRMREKWRKRRGGGGDPGAEEEEIQGQGLTLSHEQDILHYCEREK